MITALGKNPDGTVKRWFDIELTRPAALTLILTGNFCFRAHDRYIENDHFQIKQKFGLPLNETARPDVSGGLTHDNGTRLRA